MQINTNSPLHSTQASQGVQELQSSHAQPAVKQKLSPHAFQAEIHKVLSEPTSFDEKGKKILELMHEQNPEAMEKLNAFKENHAEKIGVIQQKGWTNLKAEMRTSMKTEVGSDGVNFESFRGKAVNEVIDFCMSALKEMGHEETGKHSATGTPGYASDIDTVYMAPKGMSEEAQITEKALFDVTWNGAFGGLSGTQVDTESYLNHPGAVYDSGAKVESPEGKAQFSRLELSLATLQMHRAHTDNPAQWQAFVSKQLSSAHSEEMRNAVSKIAGEINAFEGDVKGDMIKQVLKESGLNSEEELEEMTPDEAQERRESPEYQQLLKENPDIEKKAMMSYKIPRLITLSRQMDEDKQKLESINKQLQNASPQERAQLQKQAEQVELRLAARGALRNCFFDESYLTQGAFNKTCLLSGGQIHQRKNENVQSQIQFQRQSQGLIPISLSLEVKQKQQPSSQETVSSQQENLSMYVGHFHHKSEGGNEKNAVIDTSKYSERTMNASMEILASILKGGVPPHKKSEYDELKNECSILNNAAGEMEKCKRKVQINSNTTQKLLNDTLIKPGMSEERIATVKKTIADLCKMGEPGGKLYGEDSFIPQDKLPMMLSLLVHENLAEAMLDKNGDTAAKDQHVNDILRARSGFPTVTEENGVRTEDQNLKNIHNQAAAITLESLGLHTADDIHVFNERIEHASTRVRNLCMEAGHVPTPSTDNKLVNISLMFLWQQAA